MGMILGGPHSTRPGVTCPRVGVAAAAPQLGNFPKRQDVGLAWPDQNLWRPNRPIMGVQSPAKRWAAQVL